MDLDDFRLRSKAVWDAMAAGWETKRAYLWGVSRHVGDWLIANLDVRPGQTVLELACGTGTRVSPPRRSWALRDD